MYRYAHVAVHSYYAGAMSRQGARPPPPPYPFGALEPWISAKALRTHYKTHELGYHRRLQQLAPGAEPMLVLAGYEGAPPVTDESPVYDNAAQVANHDFFWTSMRPGGGGPPEGPRTRALVEAAGGWPSLRDEIIDVGLERTGSGWVWLAVDSTNGSLGVVGTKDAVSLLPNYRTLEASLCPLLCCDVWEHAYYSGYTADRGAYLRAWCDRLVDWDAAERLLA